MIKTKTLHIKIISKTYLKIFKISLKYFRFQIRLLFYKYHKTVFKNYFLQLFFKTITKRDPR